MKIYIFGFYVHCVVDPLARGGWGRKISRSLVCCYLYFFFSECYIEMYAVDVWAGVSQIFFAVWPHDGETS